MTKTIDTNTATTKELVEFYNAHCADFGRRSVKKFSDRETAKLRVRQLLEDMLATEQNTVEVLVEERSDTSFGRRGYDRNPATCQLVEELVEGLVEEVQNYGRRESDKTISEIGALLNVSGENHKALQKLNGKIEKTVRGADDYDGHTTCPSCGISLSNGVGHHLDEVNGKKIKHERYEFVCLACNEEFGPEIKKPSARGDNGQAGQVREAMKESLKLDRTIVAYNGEEKLGEWKNAFRMWVANPSWMTSAQQDRLTAKLYEAAKRGEKVRVEINGRAFELVNV